MGSVWEGGGGWGRRTLGPARTTAGAGPGRSDGSRIGYGRRRPEAAGAPARRRLVHDARDSRRFLPRTDRARAAGCTWTRRGQRAGGRTADPTPSAFHWRSARPRPGGGGRGGPRNRVAGLEGWAHAETRALGGSGASKRRCDHPRARTSHNPHGRRTEPRGAGPRSRAQGQGWGPAEGPRGWRVRAGAGLLNP